MALTEAGVALHERLPDAFGQIDDAIRDAHAAVRRQRLTVLAPPIFSTRWLARRMQNFRSKHEDLDLAILTRPDEAVRFDCTIRYGCLPRDRHSSNPILTEQYFLVCAPELLAEGEAWRTTAVLHVLDGISPTRWRTGCSSRPNASACCLRISWISQTSTC
ncbi:LysR substrate-binding domain-containing protein [Leisingera sp.]|uniref:LysR substrate-binding domain-containing protein n=1 Tax=Leisingera sp. TaxID=1879318 RepID=UPI003A8F28F7